MINKSDSSLSRQKILIIVILSILLCLWGGIYDFVAAAYGMVFLISIFLLYRTDHKLDIPLNIASVGLFVIFAGMCLSALLAKDHGIAVLGCIRAAALCSFWVLWCNLKEKAKAIVWNVLPEILAAITAISMLFYFIPQIREYLYSAGRLGGVFQYSNTYALLLLTGLVLLVYRDEKKKTNYIETAILLSGIIWCGSRSVFVLMILAAVFLFFGKKINAKTALIMLAVIIVAVIAAGFGLGLDVQRLIRLTLNSSTLNGRILYWYDAVKMIVKNPLGLGYMGYFFMQPQFQTGNYVTKYVHNDILQLALDAGIVVAVLFVIVIIKNIFSKKNDIEKRLILAIIVLHSLFDFDLQYLFMFCLLIMCLDTESDRKICIDKICELIIPTVAAIASAYFATALFFEYEGSTKVSLALYPYNTFALETEMYSHDGKGDAEKVIRLNGMLPSAYEQAVSEKIDEWEYEQAEKYLSKMIKYAGYDSYYYNQAVYYYSMCLEQAVRQNDMENAKTILEDIKNVPNIIKEKEQSASKFAYRINDKPKIELQDDIEDYIEKMSQIQL